MKSKKLGFIGIVTAFAVLVLALGAVYFWQEGFLKGDRTQTLKNLVPNPKEPQAAPVPFAELTIPHLRSRDYKSSIGQMEQVSQNQNYTRHLASYDSDGNRINGLLTIPVGQQPQGGWPAVVFVHGYIPPQEYSTLEDYSAYVDFMARNGLVVFKIDLRGHADSEGEPGGAYYSEDYIIDALNARAALASSDFVNSNKIGLWGHSMAGNVVFRSMAARPQIPAVVIWAGAGFTYEDLGEFGIDDNSYRPPQMDSERQRRRGELFETHGRFSKESGFWKQVVPTNYLNDVQGVVQLHHAVNDNVVNIEYSRNLMEILNSNSSSHQLHEYQSGGHNISAPSFNTAMQRTVDFFKEHLN